MDKQIIYTRIPRAGSSSMLALLKMVYGKGAVQSAEYYGKTLLHSPNSLWYRDRTASIKRARSNILRHYKKLNKAKVISGHISSTVLEPIFPDSFWFTTIRDPLTFIISGYYFARSIRHIPFGMSIYEYAMLGYRMNWQSMYVGDKSKFDFFIMFEHYQEDLLELSKILGWKSVPAIPHLNPGNGQYRKAKAKHVADERLQHIVKEHHEHDCALYERVARSKGRWKETDDSSSNT